MPVLGAIDRDWLSAPSTVHWLISCHSKELGCYGIELMFTSACLSELNVLNDFL